MKGDSNWVVECSWQRRKFVHGALCTGLTVLNVGVNPGTCQEILDRVTASECTSCADFRVTFLGFQFPQLCIYNTHPSASRKVKGKIEAKWPMIAVTITHYVMSDFCNFKSSGQWLSLRGGEEQILYSVVHIVCYSRARAASVLKGLWNIIQGIYYAHS